MPIKKLFGGSKDKKGKGKEKEDTKAAKQPSSGRKPAKPKSDGSVGKLSPATRGNSSLKLSVGTAGAAGGAGQAAGGGKGKQAAVATPNTGKDVPFHKFTPPKFTPPLQFVDHTVHSFAAFFMSFTYPSMTTLQFFFSLYDREQRQFLTEEVLASITIVEQVKYKAEEEKIVDPTKRGSIFKDLVEADVRSKSTFLVVRVVRVGKLQIEENEVDGVRMPVGWGVLALSEVVHFNEEESSSAFAYVDEAGTLSKSKRTPMEEELPKTPVSVYEKPYKDPVEEFVHRLAMGKTSGLSAEATVTVACRLDPLPNEHVHLRLLKRVGKKAAVAERMAPFVHTTSSQAFAIERDDLYVTLLDGMFPQCLEYSFAIITMSVRQFSGQAVNCIILGRRAEPTSEVTFTTDCHPYHRPQLHEPVVLSLKDLSNQTLHLFFQIQLFPHPEYVGPGQHLNAFLKLSTDGKFLKDGSYKLKCFTRAPGTNRMDAVYYLKSGATKTVSNGDDFICVSTCLGSSRHTQNADLNAILSWQVYPPNMLGSYIKKVSAGKLKDGDIFRIFSELMNTLLNILFSPKHETMHDTTKLAFSTLILMCLKKRDQSDSDIQLAGLNDFSCLLGYYFLSLDNSINEERFQIVQGILVESLKDYLVGVDPHLGHIAAQDWPNYDQFLGLLLADWSIDTVKDALKRNTTRRMRRKNTKNVRFTLPTAEELAAAPSRRNAVAEEEWSVQQWLDQCGMSKYYGKFKENGYTTLQDVQGLSLAAMEKMQINVPRHRKILLAESENLC